MSTVYRIRLLLSILLVLAASSTYALAADFTGTIRSSEGGPIPGAAIRVPDLGAGAMTDASGRFQLDIPPGSYSVIVSSLGFRTDTVTVSVPSPPARFVLQPAPLVMTPVTVSADRATGPAERSAFVEVIRTGEVPSPAVTTPQLLDEAVGVRVREMGGHGSFSTISIRGSSSEQVRVYLDGIPLSQALGGGVNLALIPASMVERVEVYRGVIPPSFGGSGSAGVVNLETHAPDDTLQWRGSVSYGSWNTQTLSSWVSGRTGPVGVMAAMDYAYSDNDFPYLDDRGTSHNPDDDVWARRRNNQFSSVNTLLRITSTPSSPVRWAASYGFLYSKDHLPGNSTLHELPSNASLETGQHLLQGRIATSLPLLSDGEVQGWRSFRRDQFDNRDGFIGLTRMHTDDTTASWGARVSIGTLIVPANRFAVDASAQYETYRPGDRMLTDNALRRATFIPSTREQYSAYLSDELTVDRWNVSVNGQLGAHHVVSRVTHNTADAGNFVTRDTTRATEWPRSVGVGWRITPWVEARANWGRYVRVPNLYELFGDRGGTIGNSSLKPETGTNRDIGVRFSGSAPRALITRGVVEAVYFHNTVDDAIVFWEVYNRMRPFNLGSTRVRGVELHGTATTGFNVSLSGNVTIQQPLNTSPGLYFDNDLPHQPRVQANLRAEYRFDRYTVFYGLHAHSHFYGQPFNAFGDRIPAAHLHDIGLTARFSRWFDVTLEGRNLGDVRQFHSRYVPLPGRSWMLSFRAQSR